MNVTTPSRRRWRLRWLLFALVLGLVGGGVWFSWVKWTAHRHLKRGNAALEAGDAAAALREFEDCLAISPNSGEAHFGAAQAARRCADLSRAKAELDAAAGLGQDPAAIELERALVQAQAGDLRSVEHTLVRWVLDDRTGSDQVLEVLVPALMAQFRWVEADALAAKWTQLRPDSADAWRHRGETLERLRRTMEAVEALREAGRLDPQDRKTRFNLARLLLERRQSPAEAAEHLAWLLQAEPGDPAALVQLAICREAQGLADEAAKILDDVIAGHGSDASAYYHRGRLELNRGRPAAAAPFLRRAAELDPGDPEILYSAYLCLRQVGTPAEASAAEERWKRAEADLKRVAELARAIAASPHAPDLRREMGELFLRNGREREGLRWLESALRERPDHEATHRVLAEYYDRTGRPDLADHHRGFIRNFSVPQN